MAKLTFGMMTSLDGYINDATGAFDWGQIDAEVHAHANAEARRVGTEVYGRRMYEVMVAWETLEPDNETEAEFGRIWRDTDKIVVSKSLQAALSSRTTVVPALDLDAMRQLKATATKDIHVAGPTLASMYLAAGLIDEISIYYVPVAVGAGTPMFQHLPATLKLTRLEERAFGNGVVFVRYSTSTTRNA
ncbi:MAG: dihydrofolate reductase family protein [Candidatus Sericytochromatia bacterium]